MLTKDEAFARLSKSKFRASFHLKEKDIKYINDKGFEVIESHCRDFIKKRLAPDFIENDGKQTPMKGHPVFIAQHACACCCRGCLKKWYNVPQNRALTEDEQNRIVAFLMTWIKKEYNNY